MSVWYLELDDEITDAVARLRAAKDDRVVLVVPPGSRIGTGRINFRLLAREAETRGLTLALVSGDAQVRALAASAGLSVYATVSASEAAETADIVADGISATGTDGAVPPLAGATAGSAVALTRSTAPGPAGAGAAILTAPAGTRTGAGTKPTIARRPRSRRVKVMAAGLAFITLAGGGGLYGLYVTVPRATVTLTQLASAIEPVALALTVDADQPTDAAAGIVGGLRRPLPVSTSGTVIASGSAGEPVTERARGVVTFANHSPNPVLVPDGTIVSTGNGVGFETFGGVTVPAGGTMDVEIRALVGGPGGNVDANTITQMPAELNEELINGTVTNLDATGGGTSMVQKVVLAADYDQAVQALTAQLNEALQREAAAGSGLPPGTVVYPGTLLAGAVTTNPVRELVVGQRQPTQPIEASMTGTVLTAMQAEIDSVAALKLQATIPPGISLVPGSISVTAGEPTVNPDGRVTYSASASGRAYDRELDQDKVKGEIKGKTKSEAQSKLGEYGSATITLSPDFMPTLPDDPNRIELIINAIESAAP